MHASIGGRVAPDASARLGFDAVQWHAGSQNAEKAASIPSELEREISNVIRVYTERADWV